MCASTASTRAIVGEPGGLPPLVSVVIPCLNEAENIERCVTLALSTLELHALTGEVIVVDNGSEDGSGELATRAGARVVYEPRRGYGSAYLAGFKIRLEGTVSFAFFRCH
jgi:glycosyltransferase involved in cell wall biosynthesis